MRFTKYGVFLASLLASISLHAEQKFYADDPLKEESQIDTPDKPAAIELSDLYDRLKHTFHNFGDPESGEARYVNTLDEVPDSPWFTNRHGTRRLSIEDLVRGPNQSAGPDPNRPWIIVSGKRQGLTPGFEVVDAKGDRYVIKLDPVEYPELNSAAEVIATKLFYAFGYNVPHNYVVRMKPEHLNVRAGTKIEDRFGAMVTLNRTRIDRMLSKTPRLPDGTIRVLASKYIEGDTLGPFRYYGTRTDDPNDVVPHEERRELRGLRLFAAWLNHDDSRAQNTLDAWVEENGQHVVKHYLIDFGSAFGSGTIDLQLPNLSFHYWIEKDLIKKNALGFGFHVPQYRKVKWPEFSEHPSVGRWEATYFDPEGWRKEYPNPAFVRMTARDAFWAAKILMRFTPEELMAIVETGEYSDPSDQAYFHKVLLERQRKTGEFGLNGLNPLDEFRSTENRLEVTNLSEKYGFVDAQTTYEITWSLYDDADSTVRRVSGPIASALTSTTIPTSRIVANRDGYGTSPEPHQVLQLHDGSRIDVRNYEINGARVVFTNSTGGLQSIPRSRVDFGEMERINGNGSAVASPQSIEVQLPRDRSTPRKGQYLLAEISSSHPDYPHWSAPVGVYLRFNCEDYQVVGIERSTVTDKDRDESVPR